MNEWVKRKNAKKNALIFGVIGFLIAFALSYNSLVGTKGYNKYLVKVPNSNTYISIYPNSNPNTPLPIFPSFLVGIFIGVPLGITLGILVSSKLTNGKNVSEKTNSESEDSKKMLFNESEFISGILNEKIKPSKIEKYKDKKGETYLNFDFPTYKCQMHVHFNDEKLEQISYGKIKFYNSKEEIFISNQTIAMLRHFTRNYTLINKI